MKKKYIPPRIEEIFTIPEREITFTIASDPDDPANAEAKRRAHFFDDEEEEPDDGGGDGSYWDNPWK